MKAKRLECLCLLACLCAAWPLGAAEQAEGEHVVRAASGYKAERDPDTLREIGSFTERRIAPSERIVRPRSAPKDGESYTASAFLSDHWIYDAGIELFVDADNDGYYRYLRVTFDVDSYFRNAWVYAALYLSPDGVVWELLHETDDFRVHGETPDDAYEVETELVSGYPPGDYDLLIEIYDADTGVFQDELGPADSSAFALLPLEDRANDTPASVVVVHEHGGGGAASLPLLLILGAAAALRRRARQPVGARSCAGASASVRLRYCAVRNLPSVSNSSRRGLPRRQTRPMLR